LAEVAVDPGAAAVAGAGFAAAAVKDVESCEAVEFVRSSVAEQKVGAVIACDDVVSVAAVDFDRLIEDEELIVPVASIQQGRAGTPKKSVVATTTVGFSSPGYVRFDLVRSGSGVNKGVVNGVVGRPDY